MIPPADAPARPAAPWQGVALMVVAMACVSGSNACVRFLSAELHPFEIAFFRSLFGAAILLPALGRLGFAALRTGRFGLQLVRGASAAASMLLMFLALKEIPLATATAIDFAAPLFAALAAVLALGERPNPARVIALAVGFAGTMVVVRPGPEGLDLGALYAVASTVCFAVTLTATKVLARTDSSVGQAFYMGLAIVPFALVAAIPVWRWPDPEQMAWLLFMGALGAAYNLALAQAFKLADVTATLPAGFTKMIFAALIGYLAFAEIPDAFTWVGSLMIFAAALYVGLAERRGNRAAGARA